MFGGRERQRSTQITYCTLHILESYPELPLHRAYCINLFKGAERE